MIEFLQMLVENSEKFLNEIPETKGCHLTVRPAIFPVIDENPDPFKKKCIVEIVMDNPAAEESIVLIKKEKVFSTEEHDPAMVMSMMTQIVISDLVSFALGQNIIMQRKAKFEGVALVDKPENPILN